MGSHRGRLQRQRARRVAAARRAVDDGAGPRWHDPQPGRVDRRGVVGSTPHRGGAHRAARGDARGRDPRAPPRHRGPAQRTCGGMLSQSGDARAAASRPAPPARRARCGGAGGQSAPRGGHRRDHRGPRARRPHPSRRRRPGEATPRRAAGPGGRTAAGLDAHRAGHHPGGRRGHRGTNGGLVSPAARAPRRPATSRPAPTLVDRLESLEVIVCCGSGGVGKTTVSAALGLALTQRSDRRVLVLTVDPARRLATALGLREIGTEPVTVSRARLRRAGIDSKGHLVAAMLDMKSTFDQMVTRLAPTRRDAQRILDNRFYKGISDSFVGSHEYMAMEALYELHTAGEYDTVIIDTPPSHNALDFLEAPNRLTDFVGAKMLGWLSSGPSRFGMRAVNVAAAPFLRIADRLVGADVLKEVTEFVTDLQKIYGGVQQRARDVYTLLRSPRVGFVVVTTLEPAPLSEAESFCPRLREYRMPLRGVVVNRVLPDSLRDPASLATASTLADDDRFPAWLSQKLGHRVQPNALHAIGERWLQLHGIAERDAHQLGRLERLGDVEARRGRGLAAPPRPVAAAELLERGRHGGIRGADDHLVGGRYVPEELQGRGPPLRIGAEQRLVEQQGDGLAGIAEDLGERQTQQQRHLVTRPVREELEPDEVRAIPTEQGHLEVGGVDIDRRVAALRQERETIGDRRGQPGGEVAMDAGGGVLDQLRRRAQRRELLQAAVASRLAGRPLILEVGG